MNDALKSFGYLTLGSRLKRLSDQLQSDVQQLMVDRGLSFQAAQFPILAVLDTEVRATVGELASALGVSQPGITRSVKQLLENGVVAVVADKSDARSKHVQLTPHGKEIVTKAKADLWPSIERSLSEICQAQDTDLLGNLDHLETALAEKSLAKRASTLKTST